MIDYNEIKKSIERSSSEQSDVLDTIFLPMVFNLNYKISGQDINNLQAGYMCMDHAKGIITAKPDADSYIIFYRSSEQSIDDNNWGEEDNEIHVYLENNHIIVDLPRFGAISRQSEIKFDDSDIDKGNFKSLIDLIDFNKRSEAKDYLGIKYMDRLQFRDDLGSFIADKDEHLRFISQVLNDAIKSGDSDLIDFLILKVKQRFDPLDSKDLEDKVRKVIKEDFDRRREQDNEFIIIEKQAQLERERQRRERASSNKKIVKDGPLSLDINDIFNRAASANTNAVSTENNDADNNDNSNTNNIKTSTVAANNKLQKEKSTQPSKEVLNKKVLKQGGNANEQDSSSTYGSFL